MISKSLFMPTPTLRRVRKPELARLSNKGVAIVRLEDGTIHRVELHWYEAHGIGRKKLKIKAYLD